MRNPSDKSAAPDGPRRQLPLDQAGERLRTVVDDVASRSISNYEALSGAMGEERHSLAPKMTMRVIRWPWRCRPGHPDSENFEIGNGVTVRGQRQMAGHVSP